MIIFLTRRKNKCIIISKKAKERLFRLQVKLKIQLRRN